MPILSKDAFAQIEVISATDPVKQRKVAAILNAIDRESDLHCRGRAILEELFKALLHKLMTGKIRVGELELGTFGKRVGPSTRGTDIESHTP